MPPPKIGGTFSSPLPTSQAEATDEQPNENSFEEPLPAGLGVQPGKSHVSIMGWNGSNTFPAIDDANGDQQQTRRMSAEYVKGLLGDKRIGELAVALDELGTPAAYIDRTVNPVPLASQVVQVLLTVPLYLYFRRKRWL